jgi:hypothetical protein
MCVPWCTCCRSKRRVAGGWRRGLTRWDAWVNRPYCCKRVCGALRLMHARERAHKHTNNTRTRQTRARALCMSVRRQSTHAQLDARLASAGAQDRHDRPVRSEGAELWRGYGENPTSQGLTVTSQERMAGWGEAASSRRPPVLASARVPMVEGRGFVDLGAGARTPSQNGWNGGVVHSVEVPRPLAFKSHSPSATDRQARAPSLWPSGCLAVCVCVCLSACLCLCLSVSCSLCLSKL